MKILIAEDDRTSQLVLVALLEKFGHDVVVASDGAEALAIMQQPGAPRLVILDWVMPKLDGVEVCRCLRDIPQPDPPYVILLTAKDEEIHIVEGLDAGANDYITKPYRTEELRARIRVGLRMLELQADLNQAKETLAHEAMHDALTGVLNRKAILADFQRQLAVAERQNIPLSIGMCDIDFFKKVNDQYGHQTGDTVLIHFAQILQNHLRAGDALGRYGGEEFLVIAPYSHGIPEETLFERLRQAVADTPIPTSVGELHITMSVGVARHARGYTLDQILAAADLALYQAKDQGRNRVVFTPSPPSI
ncbi:MAG: diguanylate cyclase [bacterium]|jgi:diguanylate cyclase (GGDEF)-like protein|nr:diguanylate cyclase [bacterium]